MRINQMKSKPNFFIICNVMCLVLVFLSAFTLCHADLIGWNVTWGRQFLECIKNGNTREFQLILESKNMPTNYNIFLNAFFALSLSPIYLIELISKYTIDNYIYASWFKLNIVFFTFLTLNIFSKCLKELEINQTKAEFLKFLYIASPFCLLSSIGMGQIDFLGNYFFVSGIYMFLQKKYNRMSIFIALAATVKGFALIFYIPVIILLYGKDIKKLLKHLLITLSIPVIVSLVTRIYFIDYSRISSALEEHYGFAERIFAISADKTSVFIFIAVIICGLSYYFSQHELVKPYYYVSSGMIIFSSFVLLVLWHPQWLIYSLPLLLIIAAYYKKFDDFLILNLIMNTSYIIYINANKGFAMDLNLISQSLLAHIIPTANSDIHHFIEKFVDISKLQAFQSIFTPVFILITVIFIIERQTSKVSLESCSINPAKEFQCLLIFQLAPMVIFIADLILTYYIPL